MVRLFFAAAAAFLMFLRASACCFVLAMNQEFFARVFAAFLAARERFAEPRFFAA